MRLAIAALAAFVLLTPAVASGGGEEKSEAAAPGDGTTVELPMLVAPVTVNERLYHYAYMRVMLEAKDSSTVDIARDKIPYIMDAMLREVHRESIALDGDPEQIDGDGLMKRLLAAANTAVGAGSFTSMKFRDTIQTDDPELNAAAAAAAPPPEPEPPAPKAEAHH
jgi:hypothetical protein